MFSPTVTHDSTALPGVRFTVHRMGFGRRVDLDQKTLSLRQRLRELEAESPPPNPREKELSEQLEIAKKKALAVPVEQFDAVMEQDINPLADALVEAGTAEDRKRRASIGEEYGTVEAQIRLSWIRSGLLSIEGGDVDGMTAEQLLEFGPPPLATEIYEALAGNGKLQGADAKNLPSPGTSGGPVTATTNTIAPAVDEAAGSPIETVLSSSPVA